jgi:heme exporter protein C
MMQILSPNFYKRYLQSLALPFLLLSVCFFSYGFYQGFYVAPDDYQQGKMVRIMYIHVPAAWMGLGIYLLIGICSLMSVVWKIRLAYIIAIAAAPIGAVFTLITLITGSLWGKPIWGAYWVWDARLTSMLVLFLLYIAYIAVVNAGDDINRAEKPASVVALLGVINVPIVKFSVDFWNSLHQPASIIKSGGPSIDPSMLMPLMLMFAAYIFFTSSMVIFRIRIVMWML